MARTTLRLASALIVFGVVTSGSAIAQQPAAPAEGMAAASATHSDPIVQKRMEVREANRKQREANAKIRQHAKEQQAKVNAERNQSVQQSRARATAAMGASGPQ